MQTFVIYHQFFIVQKEKVHRFRLPFKIICGMRFENCLVLFDCESESSILLERKKSPCHSVNDRHLVWHTRIILDNKYLTIHSCYFCKKEREKCKKSQELFENHGNENIYFSWFLVLVGHATRSKMKLINLAWQRKPRGFDNFKGGISS